MGQRTFNEAPRKSLVAHVESELREALLDGFLEPGTRLVTKDLAQSLAMSITPVREALVRFAASGILEADPASSFRVPELSVVQHEELVQIRQAVEGLAAESAAPRIATEDIDALERQVANYVALKQAQDQQRALKQNRELRFTLYAAAEMPMLVQVIETLWLRAGPSFNYIFPQNTDTVGNDHANYTDLIAALRHREPARARAAIEKAISEGTLRVIEVLQHREPGMAMGDR